MTTTIQIGNSDDKLTQSEWSKFVKEAGVLISEYALEIHFHAASPGSERWQNAAWVIEIRLPDARPLRVLLTALRKTYRQESLAWTEGETQFL